MSQRISDWTDYLDKRPRLKKMDMRFGTWNVRSLYRAGSLMTVFGNDSNKSKFDSGGN
jgi:hypothetical protein